MASLSNINGLFDVHSTGAILFSTSHGTSGQILRSNGNAAPTWVAASTVIGGPYLPLTGGALTGPLSGTSATFAGNVDITSGIIELGQNKIDGSSDNLKISADFGGISGSSTIEFLVDGSEKMRINNSGNVVIGTTNPNDHLEVYGAGEQWIRLTSSD